MQRAFLLLLTVFMLFLGAACSSSGAAPETDAPAVTVQNAQPVSEQPVSPTQTPEAEPAPQNTDDPAESETPVQETRAPETETQLDPFEQYRAFLDTNYDKLSELCYGGIAGVGFIDLDLDDIPELLIFDAGASAAMGVQFFDIVDGDGRVECVSANMLDLGVAFGGENLSELYVNANYFEDFRLTATADGEQSFHVISGNGAIDFGYSELIVFTGEPVEGAGKRLSLESLLYRYDDYDAETGEIISTKCTIAGQSVSVGEYESRLAQFTSSHEDAGYEAFGVFIWEDKSYTNDYAGFSAMLEKAIAGYINPD